MIAKINVGNSLLGALTYNQNKINNDKGKVLCTNKITEREDGSFSIRSCMIDFDNQLQKDVKTEKPILHISLNPHPNDVLSNEQLTSIAQEYMEKMGYGNQPYIVYKHEDISRHHIHIVSTNIDETGKKISDSNNFYKSKKITRELEEKYGLYSAEKNKQNKVFDFKKVDSYEGNLKNQITNIIKPLVARYHFMSFREYKTLLSTYNIYAEEVVGKVNGRNYQGIIYQATDNKGNKVGNPLNSSIFGKYVGYNAIQKKFEKSKNTIKNKEFKRQTHQRITSALNTTSDKNYFKDTLSKQGIDVLFRENESGRIYGVTFIDHNNNCVFNGSRLGKDLSANSFEKYFNNETPITNNDKNSENTETNDNSYSQYQPNNENGLMGGFFDLLSMDTNIENQEEERFRKHIQRKKKRKRKI
ncbi:MAG: relaxase/mobilization nuclease domain-containing protein [Bacteroidetes bacterium]|nr:relaxase/mobilization nuclease domain-containing protein [Bacteroidota bacterium]